MFTSCRRGVDGVDGVDEVCWCGCDDYNVWSTTVNDVTPRRGHLRADISPFSLSLSITCHPGAEGWEVGSGVESTRDNLMTNSISVMNSRVWMWLRLVWASHSVTYVTLQPLRARVVAMVLLPGNETWCETRDA